MRYYLDTSIWLDLLENRNEPNFPKGKWAKQLLDKIVKEGSMILLSDNNYTELSVLGYDALQIQDIFRKYQMIEYVLSTHKQIGKAKDLSKKRNIPKRDALHALLARDNNAILVTFDKHFDKLTDIIKPKRTNDLVAFFQSF